MVLDPKYLKKYKPTGRRGIAMTNGAFKRTDAARKKRPIPVEQTMAPSPAFIPPNKLPSMVGKPIHLTWAYRGAVWILDKVEGDTLQIHTPKTGKRRTAKASDAYYVRNDIHTYD